jgi:hypothetical protein
MQVTRNHPDESFGDRAAVEYIAFAHWMELLACRQGKQILIECMVG